MTSRMGTLLFVLALVGCGGSGAGAASHPGTTPATIRTGQPGRLGAATLTGFGATDRAWNASHTADSRFNPGSSYDPTPNLARSSDPQFDAKYYNVQHEGGRVVSYEMRFPPRTSVSAAKALVRRTEFPRSSRVTSFRALGSCAVMTVHEGALGQVVPGGNVTVELSSGQGGNSYDPSDVWSAIITGIPAGAGC